MNSIRKTAEKYGRKSHSIVARVMKEDLKLKHFRRVKGQRLGAAQKRKRAERAKAILDSVNKGKLAIEDIIFSDEKIFCLRDKSSPQNDGLWMSAGTRKKDIPPELLVKEVETYSKGTMVGLAAGIRFKGSPVFVAQGATINTNVYIDILEKNYFPEIMAAKGAKWVFQQDGASSHTSKDTMEFLKQNAPGIIEFWPPRSPDLNPLDYSIWSILAEDVRAQEPWNDAELKAAVVRARNNLSQDVIDKAVSQFRRTLELCAQQLGGHFESLLR